MDFNSIEQMKIRQSVVDKFEDLMISYYETARDIDRSKRNLKSASISEEEVSLNSSLIHYAYQSQALVKTKINDLVTGEFERLESLFNKG